MLVSQGAEGQHLLWGLALTGFDKAGQALLPLLYDAVVLMGKFGALKLFCIFMFYFKLDSSSECLLEDLSVASLGAQRCRAGGTAQSQSKGARREHSLRAADQGGIRLREGQHAAMLWVRHQQGARLF